MFAIIALPSFLAGQGLGLVLGYVVGLFTPGVYRKIKALLSKGKAKIVAGVGAAEVKTKAALQDVEKKL